MSQSNRLGAIKVKYGCSKSMHLVLRVLTSARNGDEDEMMKKRPFLALLLLAASLFAAGCASFAPSAYLNSSALAAIDTNRGFCVHEPSLDAKRINASKAITQRFAEAGFDTSCSDKNYAVEWWFESTDQRVDHSHLPTFCSGYGYWRSCTGGYGATLITYQRTFQLVVREEPTAGSEDADPDLVEGMAKEMFADPRDGAVWVARLDSRGSNTDYSRLIPELMQPILTTLGQDRENERMRLVRAEDAVTVAD
jgi:hypothetical protein